MALIVSAASGNFNAGATWTGGIVPGAADEARASTGHTITITADATCTEISNAGTGTFILNSGVTLTANCTNKSTTTSVNLLTFSAASPATASIVGTCTSGSVAGSLAVVNAGSGPLNVTGNAVGGTGSSGGAVVNTSTGNVTLTGNATGGVSGALGAGNSSTGTGIFTIIGNATGASGGSVGYGAFNNGSGTLNITGNILASAVAGVSNVSTGTLTITGNVTAAAAVGVNNASTGTLTISGNVTAAAAAGVNNASTGTLTITGGTYTASTSANAVSSTNANSVVRASGSFIYASNGFVPINAPKLILLTIPTAAKTRFALDGAGAYVDFFTADNTGIAPAVGDVRAGVVYGSATGTLKVPLPSQVAVGVPTDNTTGTAILTASAIWNTLTSSMTTSGSIGERLKNCSTAEITGQQLAAALSTP